MRVLPSSPLRLDPEAAIAGIDWRHVFGREGRVEVEIGTGKGRFLLSAAAAFPQVLHFGIEWSNEYLRLVESRAERAALDNVRFVRADAGEMVRRAIPAASVSRLLRLLSGPVAEEAPQQAPLPSSRQRRGAGQDPRRRRLAPRRDRSRRILERDRAALRDSSRIPPRAVFRRSRNSHSRSTSR